LDKEKWIEIKIDFMYQGCDDEDQISVRLRIRLQYFQSQKHHNLKLHAPCYAFMLKKSFYVLAKVIGSHKLCEQCTSLWSFEVGKGEKLYIIFQYVCLVKE